MNLLRRPKDLLLAGLFALTALGALHFGADLRIGVARSMGPGYFPRLLAYALLAVAGLILIRAFAAREGQELERVAWRPLLAILGGATAFGLALVPFGLIAAIPALVVVAKLAERRIAFAQLLALCVSLTLGSYLVFVLMLGQPMPMLGAVFAGAR